MEQSKEQVLLATIRGIMALANNFRTPASKVLDRIRITCHQTLERLDG